MALIEHVYLDPGLSNQFDDATDTLGAGALPGGTGDGVFYVGTPNAANQIQAASEPGIDPIVVSITDATPGADVEVADIKLAESEGALGSAVAGASLSLGATIAGGQPTAKAVWYRWTNNEAGGVYTDINLEIVPRVESAI